MKKVLIVIPNNILGGAEQILKMIACEFEVKNYNVEIAFFKKSNVDSWNNLSANIKTKYYSKTFITFGLVKFIFHKIFFRKEYDYLLSSHIVINSILSVLVKINIVKAKKIIARESTNIFKRYSNWKVYYYIFFYKLGYKYIDLLIFQTTEMKQDLNVFFPFLKNSVKLVVIPNPFEYPTNKLSEFKFKNIKYIVSAGRLIKEKGFDNLIKSFYDISDFYPDFKLIILGEGPLYDELSQLVKELNLNDKVILKGFVKDVYVYFKHAKLCVVSSRSEGFPNVLLQMMSQNNNVISTLCAGDIDKIKGLQTFAANDIDELTKNILLSLKINKNLDKNIYVNELTSRNITNFVNRIELNL